MNSVTLKRETPLDLALDRQLMDIVDLLASNGGISGDAAILKKEAEEAEQHALEPFHCVKTCTNVI